MANQQVYFGMCNNKLFLTCLSSIGLYLSFNKQKVTFIFVIDTHFPGGLEGKVSTCNVADPGSTPELGRSPEEGNGNPLQYSCLENPMDGGAWEAAVHGVTNSQTQLSDFTFKQCLV